VQGGSRAASTRAAGQEIRFMERPFAGDNIRVLA
jgi:hypothetical protein